MRIVARDDGEDGIPWHRLDADVCGLGQEQQIGVLHRRRSAADGAAARVMLGFVVILGTSRAMTTVPSAACATRYSVCGAGMHEATRGSVRNAVRGGVSAPPATETSASPGCKPSATIAGGAGCCSARMSP
jgi:hypothetical protein